MLISIAIEKKIKKALLVVKTLPEDRIGKNSIKIINKNGYDLYFSIDLFGISTKDFSDK